MSSDDQSEVGTDVTIISPNMEDEEQGNPPPTLAPQPVRTVVRHVCEGGIKTHIVWWVEYGTVYGNIGCQTCMEDAFRGHAKERKTLLIHINKIRPNDI